MAFGAMVALAHRAREGGSWLVRISLAQTGRWLVGLGEMPEGALRDIPKEFPQADLDRWSIEGDASVGRLRHLGPTVRLSETPRRWARPSVPLGYNEPHDPAHCGARGNNSDRLFELACGAGPHQRGEPGAEATVRLRSFFEPGAAAELDAVDRVAERGGSDQMHQ